MKLEGTQGPQSVLPVATYLHPDEKAWCLYEDDRLTADYKERHRWQWIYVIRNDKVAEWVEDLGLSTDYPGVPPFRIYSLWEDSVGLLREQAERERLGDNRLKEVLKEVAAESTIIEDAMAYAHERWEAAHSRSILGPKFNKQR